MLIFPKRSESKGLRITGVYFSPAAKVQRADIASIAATEGQSGDHKDNQLTHLIMADFNPNSWKGGDDTKFQEWMADGSLRGLPHPQIPTPTEGSALDRILMLPGTDVPWELIPREAQWETVGTSAHNTYEEESYPAITHPCPRIADHHPITLAIEGTTTAPQTPNPHPQGVRNVYRKMGRQK